MVLLQREGLSLLFIRKPDDEHGHCLVVAAENEDRVFEPVNVSRFPLERQDIAGIARKLEALAEDVNQAEIDRFFEREDSW